MCVNHYQLLISYCFDKCYAIFIYPQISCFIAIDIAQLYDPTTMVINIQRLVMQCRCFARWHW